MKNLTFDETIRTRRSIRRFTQTPVPATVIERALEHATLAPNSSNMQTWDFYWVKSPDKKQKLVEYCLNQSAARTAQELVVIVADHTLWKRSNPEMVEFVKKVNAPKLVVMYYEKMIPLTYRAGLFNTIGAVKWIISSVTGLFRPITRGPHTLRDLQEVAIKSAALAAENFVLSIVQQGYATCMMEGHDEYRVKKLLGLKGTSRVVMVIGIGEGDLQKGTWGPQFRIDQQKTIHII